MFLSRLSLMLRCTRRFLVQNRKFKAWAVKLCRMGLVQRHLMPNFDAVAHTTHTTHTTHTHTHSTRTHTHSTHTVRRCAADLAVPVLGVLVLVMWCVDGCQDSLYVSAAVGGAGRGAGGRSSPSLLLCGPRPPSSAAASARCALLCSMVADCALSVVRCAVLCCAVRCCRGWWSIQRRRRWWRRSRGRPKSRRSLARPAEAEDAEWGEAGEEEEEEEW